MFRMKSAVLAALLAVGFPFTGGRVAAEAPKGVQTVYTNRVSFTLPVKIDDRDRAELRELKFYAKSLQGPRSGEWVGVETAIPTKSKFGYRVTQDGEYWFAFVTVDKAGRIAPADLEKAPPGLVVVVDTKAPEVDVQRLPAASGEMFLQCQIRDANPDYATLKLEYKGIDRAWHALEPTPDAPGVFKVPDKSVLRGVVRASASDKAGNQTVREVDMGREQPTMTTSVVKVAAPAAPMMAYAPAPVMTSPPPPPPAPVPQIVEKPATETHAGLPPMVPPAADKPQLLNGVKCVLDYAIDMPNVTKVEGYATKDGGQTWLPLGEDADHKSPFEFELPGDGAYGLVLVVSTPSHAGQPPAAGDTPDWFVEIKTSKPAVEMTDIRLGTGDEAGQLVLVWAAHDKQLTPNPVSLSWATSPTGPWTLGATNMKASGTARWAVPKEAGSKVFLRLEATDLAGNVGTWESSEPVMMGSEKAHIRILGVSVKK
jgi:hypothetical protein